jgi:hypothetical protein
MILGYCEQASIEAARPSIEAVESRGVIKCITLNVTSQPLCMQLPGFFDLTRSDRPEVLFLPHSQGIHILSLSMAPGRFAQRILVKALILRLEAMLGGSSSCEWVKHALQIAWTHIGAALRCPADR